MLSTKIFNRLINKFFKVIGTFSDTGVEGGALIHTLVLN